jgi:hypothetical protein
MLIINRKINIHVIMCHAVCSQVHSCYGEELGFNSDDEGYGRDFPEEPALPPDTASEVLPLLNIIFYTGLSWN